MLRCPWHGWQFDLRSGEAWCDPQTLKARNYSVAVAAGSDLVKGPYVAEIFPVAVERDYIVIEI
ncbi:MAG: Rieske (2Fe-2S) protein [Stellaceae bacterium]